MVNVLQDEEFLDSINVQTLPVNLTDVKNRDCLQPIDIYVGRTVRFLNNNYEMSNTDIANWIIENSLPNNLNPERINMKI